MSDNEKVATYLRRATLELREARKQIRELQSDPIAIVSMACRLPGGVTTPQHLWEVLRDGRETVTGFPTDRGWDLAGLYHPDPDHPGTSYVATGGFLDDIAGFDAGFFGISPREAAGMDPQQRLLLETSWELVENAGINPQALRGTSTGVFLGVAKSGYGEGDTASADNEGYSVTGVAPAVASGRISHVMGLEGPSISVDTACSSSLVALHLAVASLRRGESSLAVVGGAAVMATPGVFVDFSRQRALAADGRSKAFGAGADGFGFAEGVSLVLLERLSEAENNGHEVLAVIRGSALNQDGPSNGLAAPNGGAQRKVIRQALENCGLEPGDVDVVEAHGTGTALGDPIEASAILDVYGRGRNTERPLLLGSVKSNIGHTQAAAGVTGLMKIVLSLQNEELPATLHADEPSPHVDWSSGTVELLARGKLWRRGKRSRRAGVSAFGISGTNAHVIVEEAPYREPRATAVHDGRPVPMAVSARSAMALRAQAAQIADLLESPGADFAAIALSLATTRAQLEHRAVVVATACTESARGLRKVAGGPPITDMAVTGVAEGTGRNVVFVFPGQGSQWAGMGAELLDSAPIFADTIRACDEAMAPFQDWKVSDVLRQEPTAPGLDSVDVVQPVLFAVMVSLAALWRSYGVEPAAVIGHSQGEIAAAHVAGALSLTDAARLVVGRSRLLRSISGGGGMSVVALSEAEVIARLQSWDGQITLAAINGPRSVVVAGAADVLQKWSEELSAEGVRISQIDVDYASHSPQMDRVRTELLEQASVVRPRSTGTTFYSTVDSHSSRAVDGTELDALYWYHNLRETVRFAETVTRMAESGYDTFIEISPHPVLVQAVSEVLEDVGAVDEAVVGSLCRGGGNLGDFLRSAATVHCSGIDVRWSEAIVDTAKPPLPTYPFQRVPYWLRPDTVPPVSECLTYRISWTPLVAPENGPLDGDWLILHPLESPEWTTELCDAITGVNGRVVRCTVEGADTRAEVVRAVASKGAVFRGVLALAGSGEPLAGAVSLLTLTQALGDAGIDAPLWCLTQGAVRSPVDDDLTRPTQAVVHGFSRAARLELGARWGGVLDLPESVDEPTMRLVTGVLADSDADARALRDEDTLALRSDRLYGRRLVRATIRRSRTDWTPHGTVLMTGAHTPIGGRLARWLAEHGASRLVLHGEHPGDELISAIEAAGASVLLCEAEDTTLPAMIEAESPMTLVHADVLTNFGRVSDIGLEDFSAAVNAKTAVSAMFGEFRFEREIYCSSVAGIWGGVSMAAYAAGSAYLDALAEHRRARGHACTSVVWTPWALPGGSDDAGRGLHSLDPESALRIWDTILAADPQSVAVADIDWPVFAESFAATRPTALFDVLVNRREQVDEMGGTPVGEPNELVQHLTALHTDEQQETLLELVSRTVGEVLGHGSTTEINVRRAFNEIGLDSLGSLALRRQLSEQTGLQLPASLVFDYPTVTALAQFLRERLVGNVDRPPITTAPSADESEPIAIVGIGCRFPGGIGAPDDLWRVLADEKDVTAEFPTDRGWDTEMLYHPDPDHPGTSYVKKGGFLSGAADFDPAFFGITPREALAMDPQQRLALETTWEAVEQAGIDPDTLRGSATGVFFGMNGQSYMQLLAGERERVEGYQGLGNSASVLSGRIAYTFGWEGPALTVDTACSSSLVAVHLAMQALRRGECSLAIAGGATVMADPYTFVDFSTQRGLAFDGKCKAFSAEADGFALAEGVAALLLEPLSRARANGHQVLAVLRGSAVNQDGASNGLAAPNGPSQERVIRQALAASGLTTADIDVVEAHGTGTKLGDPIEAGALIATYGRDRSRDEPLRIGSVKTNIGHTQAAAGAAGLIKMVLSMQHGMLPPSLHSEHLSPYINWASSQVEVLREETPWPSGERPRRAGVSSFGVSGTNAHVIIEEAPEEHTSGTEPAGPLPFVLYGRSELAIQKQARMLKEHLRDTPDSPLADVAYTLATGRAHFEVRAAVLGADRAGVGAALAALAENRPSADVVGPSDSVAHNPVFVFPGQGSQWVGMAADLLYSSEVFAASVRLCSEALAPHTDWDLLDVIRGVGGPDLNERVDVIQPVLFAIMVSLARLWQAHGVTPAAVVGHSQGEIAAAYVAGVMSLEDAAKVVALRSRVLLKLEGLGGMVSVNATPGDLDAVLAQWDGRISVAAVNGPSLVVVAGPSDDLDEFFRIAEKQDMNPRRIAVRYPSHSPEVQRVEQQLVAELGTISTSVSEIPLFSTVTGEVLDTSEMDAGYWYRNLRQPVLFEQVIRNLLKRDHNVFVEVSPHPVLLAAVEDTAEGVGREVNCVPTLRRALNGPHQFLRNLLHVQVAGLDVDLGPFVADARLVSLPTYPFERERFWPRPHNGTDASMYGMRCLAHPLLLSAVDIPGGGGAVFTGRLSFDRQPWLAEHVIGRRTLLPGSALVDLALTAGADFGTSVLEELVMKEPLELADSGALLRLSVGAEDERGRRPIEIYAAESGRDPAEARWTSYAAGILAEGGAVDGIDTAPWPPEGATAIPLTDHYKSLGELGYEYGPSFQVLRAAWSKENSIYAEVALDTVDDRYTVDPVLLDAIAQTYGLWERGQGKLPFAWNGVTLHATGAKSVRVVATPAGPDALALRVTEPNGQLVMTVDSLIVRDTVTERPRNHDGDLHRLEWVRLAEPGVSLSKAVEIELDDLMRADRPAPDVVVVRYRPVSTQPSVEARRGILWAAALVRRWLDDDEWRATTLVVATTRGVDISADDLPPHPGAAAVWGVIRCAQAESPNRFVLVDGEITTLPGVVDNTQFAIRGDDVFVPRLTPVGPSLTVPDRSHRLAPGDGAIDAVAFEVGPDADRPLSTGEVRIDVRATGINFRDVMLVLGMYPERTSMGTEAAGVVTAIGPGVEEFKPGDFVMGLFEGAFAPVAVTDHRLLAPVPEGWRAVDAAAIPIAFTTAKYALHDLAKLEAGQSVLIHSAAGGVGMAAVAIALRAGAEVFATASPAKHAALHALGLNEDHIASSRESGFGQKFLARTAGRGIDVVLNSLTGNLLDESAKLLADGGVFVEMGKTDLRQADEFSGRYVPFDLAEAGPDKLGEILREIVDLLACGELDRLPVSAGELVTAPAAFSRMSRGQHVGKLVLTQPAALSIEGTVLVTGGTGTLGRLIARHLVVEHGVRNLLVISRRGWTAPGADELRRDIEGFGAKLEIVACDAADRDSLAALLDKIPEDRPLTGVVHAAGTVADGLVTTINESAVEQVLRSKVDAAWHLHELTKDVDLSFFVLFSSAASVLAGGGQGVYAAANGVINALAANRRARGLPAKALAWGMWAEVSDLTSGLADRIARTGIAAMPTDHALDLFDTALKTGGEVLYPLLLDRTVLRQADYVPEVLRGVVPVKLRTAGKTGAQDPSLRYRLAELAAVDQVTALTEMVRAHAAAVSGYDSAAQLLDHTVFKDLGFDSLAAVELRNRLSTATSVRLPSTLVFDYPTPLAVAGYLQTALFSDSSPTTGIDARLDELEKALEAAPGMEGHESIGTRLESLLLMWHSQRPPEPALAEIGEEASDDELFSMLDQRFGGEDDL